MFHDTKSARDIYREERSRVGPETTPGELSDDYSWYCGTDSTRYLEFRLSLGVKVSVRIHRFK